MEDFKRENGFSANISLSRRPVLCGEALSQRRWWAGAILPQRGQVGTILPHEGARQGLPSCLTGGSSAQQGSATDTVANSTKISKKC